MYTIFGNDFRDIEESEFDKFCCDNTAEELREMIKEERKELKFNEENPSLDTSMDYYIQRQKAIIRAMARAIEWRDRIEEESRKEDLIEAFEPMDFISMKKVEEHMKKLNHESTGEVTRIFRDRKGAVDRFQRYAALNPGNRTEEDRFAKHAELYLAARNVLQARNAYTEELEEMDEEVWF